MKIIARILFILFLILNLSSLYSQDIEIKGKVTDAKSNEALIGVHIALVGDVHGTISDYDGTFNLKTSKSLPLYIRISYVGYESQEIQITQISEPLIIKLKEQYFLGQEVVVSASRVEENILRSSVSIEKMNLRDIQQISTSNFYEGLYQLKGVDMNVHGLTFRLPNTRGFNAYTNYRMNQIVDGVENIAPGLSFSAGNIFGLSQIDIESLEMVVGASSALYGPGGMNGTLVMKSKDPFRYQGLSLAFQTGMMNVGSATYGSPTPMYDLNIRYAKAFSKRVALKITGSYLLADDWAAADYRDRSDLSKPELNHLINPGYDGVNVYGDESLVSLNLEEVATQVIDGIAEAQGIVIGTPEYDNLYNTAIPFFPNQQVTRTGWNEKELANEKTENVRLGGSLHYFITKRTEAIVQGNYAQGTSIYTAQNRFSLRDFNITTGKFEINNPNYYFRAWGVFENSGDSYDIGGAALRLNEEWKPSEEWFADYLAAYTQTALITEDMENAHSFARLVADNRDPVTGTVFDGSKTAFPLGGSPEFNQMLNSITNTSVSDGGAMVFDKSKIGQVEGKYNFTHLVKYFEMQLGASYRINSVNSNGTIFADKPGEPINIYQYGAFLQINKNFLADKLRFTGAFRFDKNEYFEAQYTPRFSLILFLDKKMEHSLRGTYQTAYRFPSVTNQWVDLDVGVFRTIGGMKEVQNKYGFDTIPVYPLSGRNPVKDVPITENGPITIPELEPEKVTSTEIGYKGLFLGKKLFLDAYAYYNQYNGFEAVQLVAQLAEDVSGDKDLLYQTFFSTDEPVASYGWAIGLDYMTPIGILFRSNVAYNKLLEEITSPGVESRYNTPDYRVNFSIGHHAIIPKLGFNVNIHWQNGFLWEASFGAGEIPAFTTVDAHVSYKVSKINIVFKLGGSNLLNKYYTTSFGSSQIGAMYYISLVYDDILGYSSRKNK
jgi:outer membrane receptor protein involved in Fe transport